MAYAASVAVDDLSGRRLGGFELIEPLGEGSFGSVWRARQVRLDRDVAVKVLDPLVARDPNAARRFEREGRSAASLEHPSIVPVYEAGDDDGLYYLAMRLVDGETLADRIDRDAPLDHRSVDELLRPIANALDAAHASGLIHRDVKPANILIEDGRPYLSDFGIAASARELGRYTTGSIGTAEYMAPEQGRGEGVDHRCDLYALGCVAFHALTGHSPFARDDMVSTLLAHSTDKIPETGDVDLDAFFARAMAKDPDDRFNNGAEMMAAFASGGTRMADIAASSPRPASAEPPARAGRRRTTTIVAIIGVLALGVAGLIVAGRDSGDGDADDAGGTTEVATSTPATSLEAVPADPADAENGGDVAVASVEDPNVADPNVADPSVDDPNGDAAIGDAQTSSTTAAADVVAIREGGTVRVGSTLLLDDPNPHSNLDASKVLAEWVLPVMYRIDENLEPVPSLAVGPPVANPNNPLILTWEINGDRQWDDGTPVTAADIVATHGYLTAIDTNATSTFLYDKVASVERIDDTSISIELAEASGAAYLMYSTIHPIIKADAWAQHLASDGTAADFLLAGPDFSAGPYRVATGRQNAGEIELVPNQAWTGSSRPALETVEIATYETATDLVEAKSRGEIDLIWVDDVSRNELRDAAALDATEVQIGTASLATQLTFNFSTPALQDSLVRQAIFAALDRNAIVDTAVGRKINTVTEPWNSLVFADGQRDDSQPFADGYDPARAEDLLDQAGWTRPPGENVVRQNSAGELLELQGVLLSDPDSTNAALEIANNLGEIGVQFRAASGNTTVTNERINTGDFDLLLQFRVFNNDPVATEFSFASYECPATVDGCDGSGVNVGAFGDDGVDELLALADTITDPDARLDVYAEIDQRLSETLPAIPLFVEPAFTAYDDDITGVVMAPNVGPLTSLADWALLDR